MRRFSIIEAFFLPVGQSQFRVVAEDRSDSSFYDTNLIRDTGEGACNALFANPIN